MVLTVEPEFGDFSEQDSMAGSLVNFPLRKKKRLFLFLVVFFLPFFSFLVVFFRSLNVVLADYSLILLLIFFYGTFLRDGLLAPPFLYEWLVVVGIFLFLLRAKKQAGRVSAPLAMRLLLRILVVFFTLRILLVPILASTVIMYRQDQAVLLIVLAVLSTWGASLCRNRTRPSPRSLSFMMSLLVVCLVSLGGVFSHVSARPFEMAAGGFLGLLWWILFWRSSRWHSRFLSFALVSCLWFCASFVLLLPDMLSSYQAFQFSRPHVKWVSRTEPDCYDLVADPQEQCLFAAQNNIAKYFPDRDLPPLFNKAYVGGQRLDADWESKRLFMPSFMRYAPDEETFEDIYIFDFRLNLVDTLRFPQCVGPLYVKFNKKRGQIYYSCEASGQILSYNVKGQRFRVMGNYLSPNHIQLDESGDRLFVNPILGTTLDVYELDQLERVDSAPVVPPVYVSVTDTPNNRLYVARFVLGDLEIRRLDDLRVLSRIRLDQGPRDMAIDRENGRLFTCSYFTGTLCVVDLHRGEIGRLFAGPRVRGIEYDPVNKRLYFCSPLGIGYYTDDILSSSYAHRGTLAEVRQIIEDVLEARNPLYLQEFLSSFRTLVE